MSRRPTLTVNGRTFAPDGRGAAQDGACGRYRVRKSGVLLMGLDGDPFGFICFNDDLGRPGMGPGFLVTAERLPNGRVWYSHGAAERTEDALGVRSMTGAEESAIYRDVFRQIQAAHAAA